MKIRFEVTLVEGYSDGRPTTREETLERIAALDLVPRVEDTVETGNGDSRVSWVDWAPWDDEQVFVRLDAIFSLSEPLDDLLAAFRKDGWR